MTGKRDVLISIKPKFVEKILDGTKKYEFRKQVPNKNRVGDVYIYSSAPVQRVVAKFPMTEVHVKSPKEVWELCHDYAGISESDFYQYYYGKDRAHAIEIKDLKKFDQPINPFKIGQKFWPPQSYMFVDWDF
jgi:type I restriction enzyme S subunit